MRMDEIKNLESGEAEAKEDRESEEDGSYGLWCSVAWEAVIC